jgi:hypothetical protein
VVGTAFGQRVEFDAARGVSRQRLDVDGRLRLFIIDEQGMNEEIVKRLPPDTPTSPPPGSRARREVSAESQGLRQTIP